MTIYTAKPGDKKEDDNVPPPEVVTDYIPEKKDNAENDELNLPPPMIAVATRRRRGTCANLCVLLTALFVLAAGIIGSIYLYKYLAHRTFRGWCGVPYYEYKHTKGSSDISGHSQKWEGHFEEKVEIDKEYGKYEKIEVPEFEDVRRAIILHDFEKNYTAIVDKDDVQCFIMPLNRKLVKPPKDFWDLISKLRSGYYLPDAELVKENYRVIQPAITNLNPFGYYIWRECRRSDTYMLQRIDHEPIAMVKRAIGRKKIFMHTAGYRVVSYKINMDW